MLTYGSQGKALVGKELGLAVSLGAGAQNYTHAGAYGHTAEELLLLFEVTANYMGTTYLPPFLVPGAMGIAPADLEARATEYPAWPTSPAR